MDSFELNKILGAILFTLLVVMSLSIFSGVIYSPAVPEKPGFVIEVAEESSEGGAAPAVAQDPPIAVLHLGRLGNEAFGHGPPPSRSS